MGFFSWLTNKSKKTEDKPTRKTEEQKVEEILKQEVKEQNYGHLPEENVRIFFG